MKRIAALFILKVVCLFIFSACVSRKFGNEIHSGLHSGALIYGLSSEPQVWPSASFLRMLAPDVVSLSVPGEPGSQFVSIAGVRAIKSIPSEYAKSQVLTRFKPGRKLNVLIFARSERGNVVGKILDEEGNVGLWLVQQGLALPYLMCRKIDDCSPLTLERLGAYELAEACAARSSAAPRTAHASGGAQSAKSADEDFSTADLLKERIAWVGDMRKKTYLPVRAALDIPKCWRIYFQEQSESSSEWVPFSDVRPFPAGGPSESGFVLDASFQL